MRSALEKQSPEFFFGALSFSDIFCLYFFFLLIPTFFLAQFKSLFAGGKYFDNIISPGIPNIHPWNMGISPPMSPTKTRKIPSDIMNICLTIWMNVMRQVSYGFS